MTDDDIIVLTSVTVSKIIEADGAVNIQIEEAEDNAVWDSIGMLTVALDYLRDEALGMMTEANYPAEEEGWD